MDLTRPKGDALSDMLDQAAQDLANMHPTHTGKRHYQDEGNMRPSARAEGDCAMAEARTLTREGRPVGVMPGRGDRAHYGVCVDAKSCLHIDQLPHKRHTLSQPAGSALDFPHAKEHFEGLAQRRHTPSWDSMGPTQPGALLGRGAPDNPAHGEAEHYGEEEKYFERKHYGDGDNMNLTAMHQNKEAYA